MKLWRIRRDAYRIGRILGDVQAVQHGPKAIAKRVERKWLGRLFGRVMRKVVGGR
ncbi:MAG TPA: hypothetical protein VG222_02060 [Vicinamibacterales bacterium]|jgi:hypothetical protein|nr:hypothetical protein [Vicinamibacterales bacterium]